MKGKRRAKKFETALGGLLDEKHGKKAESVRLSFWWMASPQSIMTHAVTSCETIG